MGLEVATDSDCFLYGDPTTEAIEAVARLVIKINEDIPKSEHLRIPGALCGRVMNIVVWEQNHWDFICKGKLGNNGDKADRDELLLSAGRWVRLRNIMVHETPFGMTRKCIKFSCIQSYNLCNLSNARIYRSEAAT